MPKTHQTGRGSHHDGECPLMTRHNRFDCALVYTQARRGRIGRAISLFWYSLYRILLTTVLVLLLLRHDLWRHISLFHSFNIIAALILFASTLTPSYLRNKTTTTTTATTTPTRRVLRTIWVEKTSIPSATSSVRFPSRKIGADPSHHDPLCQTLPTRP